MMTRNKSKAKGTAGETEVVKYLNACGLQAQRRALHGSKDQGDIEVCKDFFKIILEVKSGKQTENPNRSQLEEWRRQTVAEGINAGMPAALVVNRYNRKLVDSDVYITTYGMVCHMYLDEFVGFVIEKGERILVETSFRTDFQTE